MGKEFLPMKEKRKTVRKSWGKENETQWPKPRRTKRTRYRVRNWKTGVRNFSPKRFSFNGFCKSSHQWFRLGVQPTSGTTPTTTGHHLTLLDLVDSLEKYCDLRKVWLTEKRTLIQEERTNYKVVNNKILYYHFHLLRGIYEKFFNFTGHFS